MLVVFLGPPGSGKGTQAFRLSKKLGVPQLSTGDILRSEISKNTDIGKKIQYIIESGCLVPSDIVNSLLYNRIKYSDCSSGFILDGYPRTVDQAYSLQDFLLSMGMSINAVIDLVVDDLAMFKRIENRISNAIDSNKAARSDDKYDVFIKRIEEYRNEYKPLADYYRVSGCLYKIDGMLGIDEISDRINSIIVSVGNKCCKG
ncbi:adenylate kinase [Candidatus Liberibacter americanus]|uniref:Adenylate kinase n=1 Tax=Candidatus Liberibacter americanus str. Sao Paulo TaxID=1261131 RepID=U6B651_9HYPH|nr:adenylate kinase [Candidatus Liberibacter americanus]AHA28254.1 Adenylate kinase [Candidatus Liberibacter americanus str. Sao Paulo]EMS36232.1 adenylate kinase [Candidatus Liberibacter americanus PW_SP]